MSASFPASILRTSAHVEELTDPDPEAILEAEEEVDEVLAQPHEVQSEIDSALEQQQRETNDAYMRLFLQSLAEAQAADAQGGGRGQQLTPFSMIPSGEEDEEEDDVSAAPADDSFLAWLRSSIPAPTSLTTARASYYARLNALRVGRWAWNLTTASALLFLPFLLASQAEDVKIAEHNLLMQLETRINVLEQGGGGGGGWGGMGGMGGAPMQAPIPDSAPPGYIPPPMEASGIPPPGRY